jgi:hypothetical protein
MDLICLAQWAKSGGPNSVHCHFQPTNPLVADVMQTSAGILIKILFCFNKGFNKCFINLFPLKNHI